MRNNTSTISIANASTADYANIDMNASTSITGSSPGAIKTKLKLQSGIDASAISNMGQSTATYLSIDSAATVTTSGGSASSDYKTTIYPDMLYLIGKPVTGTQRYLYLDDSNIICSYGWAGTSITSLNDFLSRVTMCKQVQFKLTPPVNITNSNVDVLSNFNIRTSTLTDEFSHQTLKSLFQNTVIEGAICTWVAGGTAIARDLLVSDNGDKIGLNVHGWANSTCNGVRLLVFYRPK